MKVISQIFLHANMKGRSGTVISLNSLMEITRLHRLRSSLVSMLVFFVFLGFIGLEQQACNAVELVLNGSCSDVVVYWRYHVSYCSDGSDVGWVPYFNIGTEIKDGVVLHPFSDYLFEGCIGGQYWDAIEILGTLASGGSD